MSKKKEDVTKPTAKKITGRKVPVTIITQDEIPGKIGNLRAIDEMLALPKGGSKNTNQPDFIADITAILQEGYQASGAGRKDRVLVKDAMGNVSRVDKSRLPDFLRDSRADQSSILGSV